MADTVFSRELAAAEAHHAAVALRKNKVIGRPWFNAALVLVLVGIAAFVYRAPLANAIGDAPLIGRASDALVSQFNSMLSESVDTKAAAATPTETVPPTTAVQAVAPTSTSTTAVHKSVSVAKKVAAPTALSTSKVATTKVTVPSVQQVISPSTTYFGVAASQTPFDLNAVTEMSNLVGKTPNLVGGYQTWDNDFKPNSAMNTWKLGALPMYTWEPTSTTRAITLADIASGQYDDYVARYATSIRDSGVPVALRFAHEMNGRWYTWSEQQFGNKPGDFVAAWQHVHNVFDSVGATNVVWVWSPNVVGSNATLPLSQVYPGDAYVDWVGLSGYYRKDTGRVPGFDNTFAASLKALRAVSTKPILLSEIGVGTDVENRVTWINSLFAQLPDNPDIIGFVYFNYDMTTKEGSFQDWRLQYNQSIVDAFRNGVSNARYGSGVIPG